jgi:hypothetical protein
MAGWQIDGWEQIERAGYLNDSRIRVPRGAFKRLKPDGYPRQLMLRDRMSALTPEYIVTNDPDRFPGDGTPFPRFSYTSWWPPYRREVVISHQVRRARPTSGGVPVSAGSGQGAAAAARLK